jgi:hypothetical protein
MISTDSLNALNLNGDGLLNMILFLYFLMLETLLKLYELHKLFWHFKIILYSLLLFHIFFRALSHGSSIGC